MAETFDTSVAVAATVTLDFELPVPLTFVAQNQTFFAALAIQPEAALPPVTATYVVRHVSTASQATVPAVVGGTATAANFSVTLVSLANGLAIFRVDHGSPVTPGDEEPWQLDISHAGAVATDFRVVIDHSQPAVQLPRMHIIIGSSAPSSSPPPLDFGRATFSATKTLSAIVFNTGTGDFDIDTVALTANTSGFYAIGAANPSGMTLSPNGQATIEVDYTPAPPPPAAPHLATLNVPSTTMGVGPINVSVTGEAVFRELVLCIDCSNSMNWNNVGTPLASCPIAANREPNFDPDSRIRQVRAALESFRTKLIEYGDGQTLLSIVQFPGGDLACGSSHNDALNSNESSWQNTIRELEVFTGGDGTVVTDINTATDDGYFHSTPMKAGLEEAIAKFSPGASNLNYRAVILLSDGAHNVPADEQPDDLLPEFTSAARPIRVLAIGFGESESVDHALLEDLAVQTKLAAEEDPAWTGFFAYNPAAAGNTEQLEGFYTKVFTDLFELDQAVDPTAQIARGATHQHKVLVTEFDRRVTFSIAWTTPRRELLAFELIAPNGQAIGPGSNLARYYAGPKHKMYALDISQLGNAYVGEWTLVVRYGLQTSPGETRVARTAAVSSKAVETYSYDAIMRSGLSMKVRFDKTRYATGDRVVVMTQLTENGRPLRGAQVTLQVKRPDQGIGNWYAANPVALGVIEEALSGTFSAMEQISPVFKKQYYLTQVSKIPVPAYNPALGAGVALRDDGLDGDLRAQDGIYSVALDDLLARPGIHTFTVIATGTTGGGQAFRREQVIHINVRTRIDFTLDFTRVVITSLPSEGVFGGLRRFRAYVQPQDHLGNIWGPGHLKEIKIESPGANPLAPAVDDLNGGYYRDFEYDPTTGRPTVDVDIGGQPIPPQAVPPDLRGRLTGCLLPLALLIALIIILILLILIYGSGP